MMAGFFRPHKGGTERFIEDISLFLSDKCEVTILTTNTENAPPQQWLGGVEVMRLPAITLFSQTYPLIVPTPSFFYLMGHIVKKKYDVIVTHTRFFQTTFLGYLLSLLLGIPLLHVEHGSSHIIYKSKGLERIAHLTDHVWGYLLLQRACKVATVSSASSEFLGHLGTKKEIEIIPNFVDTNIFYKKKRSAQLTVTYVGRIVEQKGIADILAVWGEIKKKFDARLLIVGEGEERKRLEGVADDVFFLGEKDTEEVAEILAMTDVFVNSSHAEGLPSSVLEACACGLPVVATDVGGTRDVIEDKFLVPPYNREMLLEKILLLLGDEEKREKAGERNKRTVCEKFSLEVVGEKFRRFIGI